MRKLACCPAREATEQRLGGLAALRSKNTSRLNMATLEEQLLCQLGTHQLIA
jgi:hypothetical protein